MFYWVSPSGKSFWCLCFIRSLQEPQGLIRGYGRFNPRKQADDDHPDAYRRQSRLYGGRIKTTTLAVILLSVWSSLRNIKGEHVFGRQLEESALKKANMVVIINLALMLTGRW
jgi:hypothetical protein